VLYNRRHTIAGNGRYGYFYLNPSGEPVQCAEIPGLTRLARSVAWAWWPARDHHSNVRFCSQDCSDGTTGIPCHLSKTVTKRKKVQSTLSYLSVTSLGITVIEDKQKIIRQNIFLLVGSGMILQYGISDTLLTPLSRLLRHACQVTVLIFLVPLLGSGNTRAFTSTNMWNLICETWCL
jgi:hypothetical protein